MCEHIETVIAYLNVMIFCWRIHNLVNAWRKVLVSLHDQGVELEGINENVESLKIDNFGGLCRLGLLRIIQVFHDDVKNLLIFCMSLLHNRVENLAELGQL